jgi:allophanate hydrolase subunit 2
MDGDVLKAGAAASRSKGGTEGFGLVPPVVALPAASFFAESFEAQPPVTAVRVLPAAEYEAFDEAAIHWFWQTDWKITAQSDRYGYRLAGPALNLKTALETRSHGVVPGVIQVPPGGPPIIQMRDAQPSGGYPKMGTVIEADLWRLAQAPAGSRIRFVETSYASALEASRAVGSYLRKARHLLALYGDLNA